MPGTVDYQLYDVFTDRPFAGNPLAVVIDPPELTTDRRQQIARELNLSETVFVSTSDFRTRIFTPATELPFAGHPTLGAALALADAGVVADRVTLIEDVGPVVVRLGGGIATLTTPVAPTPTAAVDRSGVATSLGLSGDDLHPDMDPHGWSAGLPFVVVVVRDVATLARVRVSPASADEQWYVLAPDTGDGTPDTDASRWRARMLAPGFGIAEDPATGSAAAAACGYLAACATPDRVASGWIIEQGVEMGRPSTIRVGAVVDGTGLVAATVGGSAVRVGQGQLSF